MVSLVLMDFQPTFQKYWSSVKKDVCQFVLKVLNNNDSLEEINSTFIVLIPKIKEAKSVGDFIPISLCNMLYKIVAKIIANRIKSFLPLIISQNQSVFVHGKFITKNLIITYKTLHSMITKWKGNNRFMALKLDMRKAYDRVEWDFLKVVMLKMGFNSKLVSLIMACDFSVSYSMIVNGFHQPYFKPSRGIRQGDPLHPISLSYVLRPSLASWPKLK